MSRKRFFIKIYIKKTPKVPKYSLDKMLEEEGIDEGSFDDLQESTVEALAATIDGRKAFELLDELSDSYKEVLLYRFVDQLGPREISELIEESENVVSVRIHRGLKQLRVLIESHEELAEAKREHKRNEKI